MKKHQTSSLFSVFFLKIYASIKNIKKYLDLFSSRKQFKKTSCTIITRSRCAFLKILFFFVLKLYFYMFFLLLRCISVKIIIFLNFFNVFL
jgi:hypothetical protein